MHLLYTDNQGKPQRWQILTLLGSRGKSRGFSRAFLCSSRDKHTALFPLQNSRHGRQVPPPLAEPTNRGLHFSQCLPCNGGKKESSPLWTWENSICKCFSPSTHNGVIVALEANVWFVNTSTVAVFVAAALRGTVIPHKSKVTVALSWWHTCPVHTALCTHWLTLTGNTIQDKKRRGNVGQPV